MTPLSCTFSKCASINHGKNKARYRGAAINKSASLVKDTPSEGRALADRIDGDDVAGGKCPLAARRRRFLSPFPLDVTAIRWWRWKRSLVRVSQQYIIINEPGQDLRPRGSDYATECLELDFNLWEPSYYGRRAKEPWGGCCFLLYLAVWRLAEHMLGSRLPPGCVREDG